MTQSEFLDMFADVVQEQPGAINPSQNLKRLRHWDSLAVVSFMAEVDSRLGVPVSFDELLKCKTVDDVTRMFTPYLNG